MKSQSQKYKIALLLGAAVALSAACAPGPEPIKGEDRKPAHNNAAQVQLWIDPANGCEYLVISRFKHGAAIHPRWDGDGRHLGCEIDD